jgi:hypothetical protein
MGKGNKQRGNREAKEAEGRQEGRSSKFDLPQTPG